jgi:hypothetical protein
LLEDPERMVVVVKEPSTIMSPEICWAMEAFRQITTSPFRLTGQPNYVTAMYTWIAILSQLINVSCIITATVYMI